MNPLQWFTNPFTVGAKNLHENLVKNYGGIIKDIERRMKADEEVQDCLAKTMLQAREAEGLNDLDMAILASVFMIGGMVTTASIMQRFSALIPE